MRAGTMHSPTALHPPWHIVAGMYLLYAAIVLRTAANSNIRALLPAYLAIEGAYLVLFTLILWRPARPVRDAHLYFAAQSALVVGAYALRPQFDFILLLLVLLSLQAVLVLPGRSGWMWVGIGSGLIAASLMIGLGALPGLALALMPIVIGIVFPAYITATRQIEGGLARTQLLLTELQAANQKLTALAAQAEELSAIQERNRLARQLHDSVSQTIFSISLQTRAAQILLEREPALLRPQLELLRSLAQNALEEMRGLIAQLRPRQGETAAGPTP